MTSGPDCIAERSVWWDNGTKAAIRRLCLNKQVFHRWIKQWIWGFLLSLNLFRLSWVISCVVIRHSQCYFRLLRYKISNMSEQQQQLDVYSTWTFTVLLCLSCMITQREYLAHVNSKTLFRLSQNLSKMIKLTERMSVPIQIWLKSVNEGLLDKKRKYIFFQFLVRESRYRSWISSRLIA